MEEFASGGGAMPIRPYSLYTYWQDMGSWGSQPTSSSPNFSENP